LLHAIFEIKDPLKKEAFEAVSRIQEAGITVTLLTGDHKKVASTIAADLGIQSVFSEVKPVEKRNRILELKKNQTVAMVGDGINDAPALAEADVSFAMGSGADVSLEVADITLMKKNLISVLDAIELSRATIRKIKQNLFFAFVYNSLGIPLAAAGYLSPVIAGAAMALSSVSVVTSSLLLKNWRPKK
jgi:Cu+-exporting ATPase